MAINAVSSPIRAYAKLMRPAPAMTDEVSHVAADMPAGESLLERQLPGPERRTPYVNSRGETTGTVVDTTA